MKIGKKLFSSSSSSSNEGNPLKGLKNNRKTNYNSQYLYGYKVEECNFCDQVFYNRYKILVHTASHIVIPLTRQTFYQCQTCLHHFTSQNLLTHHKNVIHGDVGTTHKNLAETSDNSESKLNGYNRKIFVRNDICGNSVHKNRVASHALYEVVDLVSDTEDEDGKEVLDTNKTLEMIVSRQPIVRCEDIVTNLIRNKSQFIRDYSKYVDVFKTFIDERKLKDKDNQARKDNCYKKAKTKHSQDVDQSNNPEEVNCFNQDKESTKLASLEDFIAKIPVIRCETTITELLTMNQVKGKPESKINIKERLIFEDDENDILSFNCEEVINEYIDKDSQLKSTVQENSETISDGYVPTKKEQTMRCKQIKVCELCKSFLRGNMLLKYVMIGTINQLGKQQRCSMCSKKYFEVYKFARTVKRIEHYKRKVVVNSKEIRLKNISKRLKMFNKLGRC